MVNKTIRVAIINLTMKKALINCVSFKFTDELLNMN